MLIAIIPVTDYSDTQLYLFQIADRADGIELRLDYLSHWDIQALSALRRACTLPVIFTLRSKVHGGHYPHSEAERLKAIMRLCTLNPDYLDLEYDVPTQTIQAIRKLYPAIKLILSYHNFEKTPEDLSALFQTIYQPDCYAYKIATHALSTLDALRMLHFVKTLGSHHRLIGLCMGEYGQCTRILAPVVGSLFSYAYLDASHATAPGQLSLHDLSELYHYRQLNTTTKIYGLLGDPVHWSVGHILHNRAMVVLQQNAVYVKLRITQDELLTAMCLLQQLPCWGLSVTMPLKEAIVPFLDDLDDDILAIQAVNTVVKTGPDQPTLRGLSAESRFYARIGSCEQVAGRSGRNGGRSLKTSSQWFGTNTDGPGALEALSQSVTVSEKIIVIFGAGGAARAIAYTALKQGAKVILLNRHLARAKKLAMELGCDAYELNDFPILRDYHICINTLPLQAYDDPNLRNVWHPDHIKPSTVVMDIVYQPMETFFLSVAQGVGCECVPGFQMYVAQAVLQVQQWFQPKDSELQNIAQLMRAYFKERRR